MTKFQRMFNGLYKIRVVVHDDHTREDEREITDYYLSDDPLIDSFKMKISIYSYVGERSEWGKVLKPKKQIEDLRDVLEELPFVKGDI